MRKFVITLCFLISVTDVIGLNGVCSRTEEFPFQVSVRVGIHNDHICSASIITPNHLITTASCVVPGEENVILGNIKIFIDPRNGSVDNDENFYEVRYVIYHQDYVMDELWKNDICILRLAKRLIFNEFREPVALPSRVLSYNRNKLVVSGWKIPLHFGHHFQKLNVIGLTHSTCTTFYKTYGTFVPGQSCLTTPSRLTLSHFVDGDSGTPITSKAHHVNHIIGIVSLIPKHRSYPIVYTNIVVYNNWIFDKIHNF